MLGLIQLVRKPVHDAPIPRLWLVFFSEGDAPAWWKVFFARGWRHVQAAAWYAEQERWVWYNPTWRGTVIELYRADEFDGRLGQLATDATAVLRVRSGFARSSAPAAWHCVGAVKALLGLKTCALGPKALHDHLLGIGAETVEVPGGRDIQQRSSAATGREPGRQAAA